METIRSTGDSSQATGSNTRDESRFLIDDVMVRCRTGHVCQTHACAHSEIHRFSLASDTYGTKTEFQHKVS